MDCRRVQGLLEEYFEGTLPARRQALVREHLDQCHSCAAELAQIEKIAGALAAVPHAEPAAALLREIAARTALMPSPSAQRALLAGWRRLGVLAAALLAALIGVHFALMALMPRASSAVTYAVDPLIGALTFVQTWFAALPKVGRVLWEALVGVAASLGSAFEAVAPDLMAYAVAELALLVLVVVLCDRRRRAVQSTVTSLL
jgi:predicted anti-sigma-YlaC factor YlaD